MEEKHILQASLIITLIGLTFLYFYAEEFDTKVTPSVEQVQPSTQIKMIGKITKITTTDKATFLQIEGQRIETTNVILFNKENIFLPKGAYAEIYGTVENFNGQKEIVASKIVLK